jgi:FkbM family methyltransferase
LLLNVAVSDRNQLTPFYFIDDVPQDEKRDFPAWFDQLGSFSKEHIIAHLGNTVEKYVKSMMIPTVSLDKLFELNSIAKLDVLHIDTEGHDWIIIKQLDLSKFLPEIILIENKHLTMNDDVEFRNKFQEKYKILNLGTDYLCYLKK